MKKFKIVGGILIAAGIIVISSAIGMRLWAAHKEKAMINDFQRTIAQEDNKSNADSSTDAQPPADAEGAIGIITIPKINLKVAVGEGVDLSTLKYAVGHFKGTAMPGQKGNFCVAGHRSYTYSEYFNRLGEIKNGDIINVQAKSGTYTYKVYNISVVTPDHVEVLNPTSDATMTLVTCTPIRIATHRLIINARLVEKQ
ncbi:MAG: class D sortase [Clostridium sp.]|uniref:class D sortase n=1 Tax=Clostridium sp. TaxID=1506 RepID=UPI0039EABF63